MNISEELNSIPFFSKLSSGDLKKLESYLLVQNIAKDTLIATQGDNCKSLYAIVKGRIKAKIAGESAAPDSEITLASGTVFGSMALIANIPMFATLTSIDEVTLLTLDHNSFNEIYDKAPRLYESIMKELISRVQYQSILGMHRFKTRCIFITCDQQSELVTNMVNLLCRC
jgi:CRP-like cAMP-binding protein